MRKIRRYPYRGQGRPCSRTNVKGGESALDLELFQRRGWLFRIALIALFPELQCHGSFLDPRFLTPEMEMIVLTGFMEREFVTMLITFSEQCLVCFSDYSFLICFMIFPDAVSILILQLLVIAGFSLYILTTDGSEGERIRVSLWNCSIATVCEQKRSNLEQLGWLSGVEQTDLDGHKYNTIGNTGNNSQKVTQDHGHD